MLDDDLFFVDDEDCEERDAEIQMQRVEDVY